VKSILCKYTHILQKSPNKIEYKRIIETKQHTIQTDHITSQHITMSDNGSLNPNQHLAFEQIISGKSIYLCGAGGTGKSFLLSRIISHYKLNGLNIGISAATGIAAIQIKGRTVHGLLGLGVATRTAAELFVRNRRKYPNLMKIIRNMNCLIIDEISMISAELLDKISNYLKLVRNRNSAFGGIQVILSGDFCQLPPVNGEYCFKSESWDAANLVYVELSQSMRQADDAEFVAMLGELRFGRCSDETLARLRELHGTQFAPGIEPTVLYSRNNDADAVNTAKLVKLMNSGKETQTYKVKTSNHVAAKVWVESLRIEEELVLCVGAQVMISVNLNVAAQVVNGSRGVITELLPDVVRVRLVCGRVEDITYYLLADEAEEDLWVSYIPLKLAYAVSIHKSQSLTLDAVVMDLGLSIFAPGQAYTAISRARTLGSIQVSAISQKSFKVSPEVVAFYKKMELEHPKPQS
jgi:hypothetical protein